MMRRFILLAAICLACTACSNGPTTDPLNPPDAPVIPPGRSAETTTPGAPTAPGAAPGPTVPAR